MQPYVLREPVVDRMRVVLNKREPSRVILAPEGTRDRSWICNRQGIQAVALCIVRHLAHRVLTADELRVLVKQTVRILRGEDDEKLVGAVGSEGFECKIQRMCEWPVFRGGIVDRVDLDENDIVVLINDYEPPFVLMGLSEHPNTCFWKFRPRDLVEFARQILQGTDLRMPQAEASPILAELKKLM